MSADIFKIFNNIRTLRANVRDLSLNALEEILEKFKIVVEERRQEEIQRQTYQEEHQQKLLQYRNMLLADGIDPTELVSTPIANVGKRRTPRPPKYQYIDKDGKVETWTGQGRTPIPIKEAIEHEGKSLEMFLIP